MTRYLAPPWLRRRRRVGVLWPLLILLAAFVGFVKFGLTTEDGMAGTAPATPFPSPTPSLETPAPTSTPSPLVHPDWQSLEQATVVAVIDGDTIDVLIGNKRQVVRYYGIDAPEEGEKCYEEAVERNRQLVGTSVRLEAGARDEDESGRLLRYVFTDTGVSVDAALVSEGLARARGDDGRYVTRLTTYETYARDQGTGCLWK